MKAKRIKVMCDRGRGLRWYYAFQVVNQQGERKGFPQATRKQALSEVKANQ